MANLLQGAISVDGRTENLFSAFKDASELVGVVSAPLLKGYLRTTRTANVNVADFVWMQSGAGTWELKHMHSSMWKDIESVDGSVDGRLWTEARQQALTTQLLAAPAYNASVPTVRLSIVLSQFLPSSQRLVGAVNAVSANAEAGWGAAKVVLTVQNGVWYIICGIKDNAACPRPSIRGSDTAALIALYEAELGAFTTEVRGSCGLARFTCFFATDAYVGNLGQLAPVAMAALKAAPWIHAIDFYTLGSLKPDEILKGHGSVYINLIWAQLMWSTLLPSQTSMSCATQPVFERACFGSSLRDPTCGEACACTAWDAACEAGPYLGYGQCAGGSWDRSWECANERACMLSSIRHATRSNLTAAVGSDAVSACAVDLVRELVALSKLETSASAEPSCSADRLWCSTEAWAWGLTGISWLAVALLVGWYWCRWAVAKKAGSWREAMRYWRPERKKGAVGEHLAGLNAARILASIHIVIGHLYAYGASSNVYFFGWGFTWVPWFFMLSGYVLTHAQLARKDPSKTDPVGTFFRKRSGAVYPLYAVGLVLALAVLMAAGRKVPVWYVLLSQAFLTQAWVPWLSEQTIQLHCWFLSAMVPYWALFGLIFRHVVLRLASLRAACAVLVCLALLPWLAFVLPEAYQPTGGDDALEWYGGHSTGSLKTWTDVLVVFLKFHPFCYLHVFVFGMLLARMRERLKATLALHASSDELPHRALVRLVHWLLRWGTSLGYALLLCVFLVKDIRPYAAKLSARLSILMVPQGLILIGLSPLPPPKPLAKVPSPKLSGGVQVSATSASAPPSPPTTPKEEEEGKEEDQHGLAEGWEAVTDSIGRTYWWCPTTDAVTWQIPLQIPLAQAEPEQVAAAMTVDARFSGEAKPERLSSKRAQRDAQVSVDKRPSGEREGERLSGEVRVSAEAAGRVSMRSPERPSIVVHGLSMLHTIRQQSSGLLFRDPEEQAKADVKWVEDFDQEDTFASGETERVANARGFERRGALSGRSDTTETSRFTDNPDDSQFHRDANYLDAFCAALAVSAPPARPARPTATEPAAAAPAAPAPALVAPLWREVLTTDPIARLFARAPAAWGNVSYGQYVFQTIAYQLWPVEQLDGWRLLPHMVFLLSCAWLSAELCTIPARSWWLGQKDAPHKLWAPPCATAAVLLAMGVPYYYSRDVLRGGGLVPAPPYVAVGAEALDVRLNWTAPEFEDEAAPRVVINPSLLLTDGGLMRAARVHSTLSSRGEGIHLDEASGETLVVTELITEWKSDVVMHSGGLVGDLAGWDVAAWALDGSEPLAVTNPTSSLSSASWGPLCEPTPKYVAANNTLFRKLVSGPEDPKLMQGADGSSMLTFSSLPPAESRPGCHQQDNAVVQMYAATTSAAAVGVRLDCGKRTTAEKNWISFVYGDQLYYVYSIHPHVIVQVRAADGVCVESRYSTSSYQPLARLSQHGGYQLHGSATAVMNNGTYLALMHTIDNAGHYVTMAYRFEAHPPFAVVAVSRPLPLQGLGGVNFASGLLVPHGCRKVIVSYGAADLESRVLVMSTGYFETFFDFCPAANASLAKDSSGT